MATLDTRTAPPMLAGRRPRRESVLVGVFVVVPLLALLLAVPLAWGWGIGWTELALALGFYCLTGLGVTVGFHRYFTHGAFRATRPLRIALAAILTGRPGDARRRGITVHEALAAADRLPDDGVRARVIDLYSVKPIDAATLRQAAAETDAIVTVEDHWPRGGLADAVLEALADDPPFPRFAKLGVRTMPVSASPAEQLREAGIDAAAIVETVRGLVGS